MSNEEFRRDLNNAFDAMSGATAPHLGDRVRASLAGAPRHPEPYWLAGVAAVVMAALLVGVLYVANPFRSPKGTAGGGPIPTPSSTAQPTVQPTPSEQPFTCVDHTFVTASKSTPPPLHYISALRTGTHAGYDRLTIEFANDLPASIEARYVTGTTYTLSPSGIRTVLKGQNSILIIIQESDLHTSYSGSIDIVTSYAGLVEVKRIEDFEGRVQLALGVNGASCYRVSFLPNPNRMVIDVQNS